MTLTNDQAPPPERRCSFCNKSQREVRKLVAGPDVYICDECIDICVDVITDEAKDSPPPQSPALPLGHVAYDSVSGSHLSATCSLCHVTTPVEHTIAVHRRGALCVGCVGAIEAAV